MVQRRAARFVKRNYRSTTSVTTLIGELGRTTVNQPTQSISRSYAAERERELTRPPAEKRPRQNDVDVIAAGNADPEVMQQLAAAVTQSTT